MTLPDLGRRPADVDDAKTRRTLVRECLEEYRWEPDDVQLSLLCDEPPATGDERWNVLLAALAERLAAQHDRAAPECTPDRRARAPCRRAAPGRPPSCRSSCPARSLSPAGPPVTNTAAAAHGAERRVGQDLGPAMQAVGSGEL